MARAQVRHARGVGPLRPLVAIRGATPFDPRFSVRDPLLSILEPAYVRLGRHEQFPEVGELERVFAGDPPVRFVPAGARRRRGQAVDVSRLYDARISVEGVVPTRPRCWHDFMNALVWGTFPRSKQALHRRQYAAIAARVQVGALRLPPRSPELDALALLDEGGVIVLAHDEDRAKRAIASARAAPIRRMLREGQARVLVFGHAIYEGLALGVRPAVVAATVVAADQSVTSDADMADRLFASALDDPARYLDPRELARLDLRGLHGSTEAPCG